MKNIILWQTSIAAVFLLSGCSLDERIPAEMARLDQSRPLAKESSLQAEVSLDIGSIEISGESLNQVYSFDLEYDKAAYEPQVSYDGDSGGTGRLSLKLQSTHKKGIRSERENNRLHLNLTDTLPVSLRINSGVGDARLALSRLHLSSLDLESGVGGARLSSYEANPIVCDLIRLRSGVGSVDAVGLGNLNFRRLEFEGGVGGASLDFSGQWKQDAEVRIEVGVGGVTIRMPRDVGVRVSAEKHFLSGLQLDGFHKEAGEDYYSANYSNAKVRVSVTVKTGVGGFKISWL
jgi:hypothetical protein